MNTANDLLRRALERFDWLDIDCGVVDEIRAYLDAPEMKDEPFGYVSQHGLKGAFELQFNRKLPDVYRDTALSITPVYSHPPTKTTKPAPDEKYDFSQVIPLTHQKTKGIIQDKNFYITGFVLTQEDGDKCIVDMSAVRWLSMSEFHDLMHPLIESPTKTAPKDEPVAWVQDSDYEQSPEFAFSWVETKLHDVPLYLHPPTKTTKTAPMKPMTREEILAGLEGWDWHPDRDAGFYAGIRFAERFHKINDVRDWQESEDEAAGELSFRGADEDVRE